METAGSLEVQAMLTFLARGNFMVFLFYLFLPL